MKKRILSLLMAFVMAVGLLPVGAMATGGESITVYVTISNQGVLATDKNGDPMGYRDVTVTDQDKDGKLTVSDAMIKVHTEYSPAGADGYAISYGFANKLWGVSTSNLLAFVNNEGFSVAWDGKGLEAGDHVVASINADNATYADWYTYFDQTTQEIKPGEELSLTLKGFQGMAGGTSETVSGMPVGVWNKGVFTSLGSSTDSAGQVALSFDTPGTYYVTASGTIRDEVTDWTAGTQVEKDCPIIAPVCVVTVSEERTDAEYVAADKNALDVTYTQGQNLTLPTKGQSGKTDITWTSSDPDVISNAGVVTVPAQDTEVTLTAAITCHEASDIKTFPIMVLGRFHAAKAALTSEALTPVEFTNAIDGYYRYDSAAKDTNILTMANQLVGHLGVTVGLSSAVDGVIDTDGTISYPVHAGAEITVPLTLSADGASEVHAVTITVPKHAQTKAEAIESMKQAMPGYMADDKVLNGNTSLDEVKTSLLLPGGKTSGLYITWASNNESVIKVTGNPSSSSTHPTGGKYEVKVNRPDVGEQDAVVALTASFVYKETSVLCGAGPMPAESERQMTFTVKVPAVTESEMQSILDRAADDVKIGDKNGAAADLKNIKDNLYFPSYEGYTTAWSTELPIVIPSKGYDKAAVTRPTDGEDASGTITLTLTKGATSKTKTFDAKVLAWTDAELESERAKLQKVADGLTFDEIKNKNTAPTAVTSNLHLKQSAKFEGEQVVFNTYNSGSYPYKIEWTIDPVGTITFSNGTGKVAVPAQDTTVKLQAKISLKTSIDGVEPVQKTIPVTVLSAETEQYLTLMNNIAAKYAASGVAESDQAPWLAADMAAYQKLFPNTANKLSGEQKQAMTDLAIEKLAAAETPSEAAKYILSLVSMGYDPTQLTTAKLEALNGMEKLNALSFDETGAVTAAAKNPYTLPYVLIVYQQFGSTYQAQIDKLAAAAVETKSAWMNTDWGPDSITPMVLALAPYGGRAEVAAALDEAKTAIASTQVENGALASYGSGSAASTGLGIVAYASLGTDPKTVATSDKHLMDGLMAYAADSKDGFQEPYGGSFNTEQGFRGLIAFYGLKSDSAYRIYDFSGQTLVPAAAAEAQAENCSVQIIPAPAEASVVVKKGDAEQTPFKAGHYDLAAGDYTYTAACDGYITKTASFSITEEDVTAGNKTIRISLEAVPAPPVEETLSVSISVANPYGGFYQPERSCAVAPGTTAAELLLSLGLNIVSSSNPDYGFYVESINGVGEFDLGSESGWMFKVNGVFPRTSADKVVLQDGDAVEWVYTRQLGGDVGDDTILPDDAAAAAQVEALIDAIGTVTKDSGKAIQAARTAYDSLTSAQKDLVGNYSKLTAAEKTYDSLLAAQVEALIDAIGTVNKNSGKAIQAARTAYDSLTKAQKLLVDNYSTLAVAEKVYASLMDMAHPFTDAIGHWAEEAIAYVYQEGLMTGTKANRFSPEKELSRAMLVTILYRMEGAPAVASANPFSDVAGDTWYTDAVIWASENGIVSGVGKDRFAPDRDITREQMATMLLRYSASKNYDTTVRNDLSGFADAEAISGWALDALQWANAEGLVTGRKADLLVPQGDTTRAETAAILMRYLETIA